MNEEDKAIELTQPLAVYRIWRISGPVDEVDKLALRSMAQPTDWNAAGANEAICLSYQDTIQRLLRFGKNPESHKPPAMGCLCGFYGYSELTDALVELVNRKHLSVHHRSSDALVLGAALFWGLVIVGQVRNGNGLRFRAQRAQMLCLKDDESDARISKFAEANDLTSVYDDRYMRALAKEHGEFVSQM